MWVSTWAHPGANTVSGVSKPGELHSALSVGCHLMVSLYPDLLTLNPSIPLPYQCHFSLPLLCTARWDYGTWINPRSSFTSSKRQDSGGMCGRKGHTLLQLKTQPQVHSIEQPSRVCQSVSTPLNLHPVPDGDPVKSNIVWEWYKEH